MIGVEAIEFAFHAAPPAAFMMARFTATRANCTLYALRLSGLALRKATSAAALATSSDINFPCSACSASAEIHGTGATDPSGLVLFADNAANPGASLARLQKLGATTLRLANPGNGRPVGLPGHY